MRTLLPTEQLLSVKLDVKDAAVLDILDALVPLDQMENQEFPERLVRLADLDDRQLFARKSKFHLATHARQVHLAQLAQPDHRATQDDLDHPADPDLEDNPAHKDHPDHLDRTETPEAMDQEENQDDRHQTHQALPENQEAQENLDHQVCPETTELQDATDNPALPDRTDHPAHLEHQERMDHPDQLDNPVNPATRENVVFARNIAPWTAEYFSKMEQDESRRGPIHPRQASTVISNLLAHFFSNIFNISIFFTIVNCCQRNN